MTTESFAVETAMRALGFSYNDLIDCFQIANDIGLFTGTPTTQNLTLTQKKRIIAKAKEISVPVEIPKTPEGEVVFSETTQMLADTDLNKNGINPATEDGTSGTLILAANKTYTEGERIILPASKEDDPVGGSANQSGFEHYGYFLVGSSTVVNGQSFASSHQTDVLKKPSGSSFVLPSLSTNAYNQS